MVFNSYGVMSTDSGSVQADYVSYTGREAERDLHIYYYRARYYDPLTGRFMVRDPLDFHGGDVNLYRYVANNPMNMKDPSGLTWLETFAMFARWSVGAGPDTLYFGPYSNQVRDMMDAPRVNAARDKFYEINAGRFGPCALGSLEPVEKWVDFGGRGYIEAGLDPTEQFVGRFYIQITPNSNGTITFTIINRTSMTSFTRYIFGNRVPSWSRSQFGPFGDMYQVYTWTEVIRR